MRGKSGGLSDSSIDDIASCVLFYKSEVIIILFLNYI